MTLSSMSIQPAVVRIERFTSKRHCYKTSSPTFSCMLKDYVLLCPWRMRLLSINHVIRHGIEDAIMF